jgi:LacI family transcriptional regulator
VRARRAATILDVAERSGVSKSTVSNVVRGVTGVGADTRRRVLEAIAELDYRPNAVARDLVRRRTSTVGLVVGDLANPFYSELAKLVERQVALRGYAAMICDTDGRGPTERQRIETLLEHRVAGIVMLQFSGSRSVVGQLNAGGVPLVVISCWEEETDCVAVDDEPAVAHGTRHLVELGHRRVAYLSSHLVEPATDAARRAGWHAALAAAGVPRRDRMVVRWEPPADLHADAAKLRALERVLEGPRPPTAFVAGNDLVAIELLEALEGLGRRVPQDVSVVGFDDIAIAGLGRLGLTTVSQPTEELARRGVDILMARMEGTGAEPLRQERLEATLRVRRSTAPPPVGENGPAAARRTARA